MFDCLVILLRKYDCSINYFFKKCIDTDNSFHPIDTCTLPEVSIIHHINYENSLLNDTLSLGIKGDKIRYWWMRIWRESIRLSHGGRLQGISLCLTSKCLLSKQNCTRKWAKTISYNCILSLVFILRNLKPDQFMFI